MTADFFGGSDTSLNNPDSIAPVRLGEPASPGVLGRPSEILRERTVRLQAAVRELRWIVQTGGFSMASIDVSDPSTISWPGPYDGEDEALGRPTVVGDLVIFPRVGPGAVRSEDASGDGTPWASRRGELVWTFGASTLTLYAQPNEADGGAQLSIEVVVDPAATGITLVVQGSASSDDEAPFVAGISHIKATVTSTTTVTQLSNALNTDNVVVAALVQTVVTGTGADFVTAKTRARILGTRAAIRLVLGDSTLDDFFDASDENLLREGDVLGLWAGSVADLIAQQLEDVSAVDVSWLVNMTRVPEAAGAAIPLARVIDGDLHLCSGVVVTTYPDPPPSGWTYPFTVDQGHADGLRTYPFDGGTFNLNERTVAGQLREIVGGIDDLAAGGLNFTRLAVNVPSGELPLSSERVRVSEGSAVVGVRLQRTSTSLGSSANAPLSRIDTYHYHGGSATLGARVEVQRNYDATYLDLDTAKNTAVVISTLSGAGDSFAEGLRVAVGRTTVPKLRATTVESESYAAYADIGSTATANTLIFRMRAYGFLTSNYPSLNYTSALSPALDAQFEAKVNAGATNVDFVFVDNSGGQPVRVVGGGGLAVNALAGATPLTDPLVVCPAKAQQTDGGTSPTGVLPLLTLRREWVGGVPSPTPPSYGTGASVRVQLPRRTTLQANGTYPVYDAFTLQASWWDNTDVNAALADARSTTELSLKTYEGGVQNEILRVFGGQWFIGARLDGVDPGADPLFDMNDTAMPSRGTTLHITGGSTKAATDSERGVGLVISNTAADDVSHGRPMTLTFCGRDSDDQDAYELARISVSNAFNNASAGDRQACLRIQVHPDNNDNTVIANGATYTFRHDGALTASRAYASNLPAAIIRVTDGSPPTETSRGLDPTAISKTSTGIYVISFDENQLSGDLDATITMRGSTTPLFGTFIQGSGAGVITVTVRLYDASGTLTDGNFTLVVYGDVTL